MYSLSSLSLVPRCQKMTLTRRAPNTRACCPHATGANTGEPHTRSPTTSPHPPARRHSMATRCHLKRRAEVSDSMAGSNSTSSKVDTLGIEPRAFHMRSGCDTTTPCAHDVFVCGQTIITCAESTRSCHAGVSRAGARTRLQL